MLKTSLKETSADIDKTEPKLYYLPLQHQDISTETAIFIATKHKKTSNFFLHFEFKISNKKKNQKTNKNHDILS